MNAHSSGGPAPRRCPICNAPSVEGEAPFCSRRCRNIDLHRWFTGKYRIPTPEAPQAEEERENPDQER
jgi:endogenous inhibitor of DNA gyrase (YacG/DUF329 family)